MQVSVLSSRPQSSSTTPPTILILPIRAHAQKEERLSHVLAVVSCVFEATEMAYSKEVLRPPKKKTPPFELTVIDLLVYATTSSFA